MQLRRLEMADIIRDGGSYEAFFSTDEPLGYYIFLQCQPRFSAARLQTRHKYLYACRTDNYDLPRDALPIITGSEEEQQILRLLKSFLESASNDVVVSENALSRLEEMVACIPQREPCSPDDPIFTS